MQYALTTLELPHRLGYWCITYFTITCIFNLSLAVFFLQATHCQAPCPVATQFFQVYFC